MEWLIAWIAIGLGSLLLLVSSFYLFHYYGKIVEKQKTSISIFALRHASILGIAGMLIIFIGILYLMEIIPL